MKNKSKKIVAIVMLILTIFFNMQNLVYAETEISKADLFVIQPYEFHLQYWYIDHWSYTMNDYVGYTYKGVTYPAYCLEPSLDGVGVAGNYTVNISETLSDVRVWRTIISGFPYKTASELGVDNDLDAYVATQHAIYSVIFNYDVRTRYNGADARGQNIIDSIERLTNEGRYGTITPQSANASISKIGEFVEQGNYYSQSYQVSSTVGIDSYTVNVSNMPVGGYIADTNNNPKTIFNSGEIFKVIIPKDALIFDVNSTIFVQAKCKVYPVFYRKIS